MVKTSRLLAAIALTALSAAASAALPEMSDAALGDVTGQDGVALLGQLNVNVGSFVYTNTSDNNASLSINGIHATGFLGAVINVVSQATLTAAPTATSAGGLIGQLTALSMAPGAALANANPTVNGGAVDVSPYYTGGDVLQISMPAVTNLPKAALLNVVVDSIRTGATTYNAVGAETQSANASMGKLAINQIDLSGTKVFVFGHN